MILEFMDAGSLGEAIRLLKSHRQAGQPLIPEPVAGKIIHLVLNGLLFLHKYLHEVHRDIKPDNILLDSFSMAKLTDYGISKQLEHTLGVCNSFIGTLVYIAPEKIDKGSYSFPSDVWSLGLVLIEMITGEYPYGHCGNLIDLCNSIKMNEPPRLPDNGTVSPEL